MSLCADVFADPALGACTQAKGAIADNAITIFICIMHAWHNVAQHMMVNVAVPPDPVSAEEVLCPTHFPWVNTLVVLWW